MAIETFPNPPITEALLNINAVLPPETTLPILLTIHDKIRERFPHKNQRVLRKFELNLGAAPEAKIPPVEPDGYLFWAPDKLKVVQARLDGFAFSKLRPYENWTNFNEEAKELWNVFLTSAKPVNIQQVGLRYINKIELPLPIANLDKFFTTVPRIPLAALEGISPFFMQFSVGHPGSAARGLVTHIVTPFQPGTTALSYILDIDVSILPTIQPPDIDTIWNQLNLLHDFKNDIFFSSITEETKKLFR